MIFTKINPAKHLQHLIRYFWWIELNCGNDKEEFTERILPDVTSEIVFHLADKVRRTCDGHDSQCEPNCFLAGQNTSYYNITARGFIRMVGVKLHPHTASFLCRENASRFNNTVVDLSTIWGNSINTIHEKIAEAQDLAGRISPIERFLSARLREEQPFQFEYLDYAVRQVVQSHGQVALPQIAQALRITMRYLEKLFLERVGMPPKLFAQIIQLQSSVRLLNADKTRSLTNVSHLSGYYDQSHFNRAVKRFTGLKPSELKREKMLTQQPFLDAAAN